MADFKYKLNIDVENRGIKETRAELERLKKTLEEAQRGKEGTKKIEELFGKNTYKGMSEAKKAIEKVSKALDELERKGNDATIMDFAKFNNEIKSAGVKVKALDKAIERSGVQGAKSIGQISKATYGLGYEVDKLDDKFSKLGDDIQHELVDNLVGAGFDLVRDSISKAIYFTKDLDRTLTDIQIVSGKSAEEMAKFAEQSNEAARALGSTTDEFANASLIFFQQGGYTAGEVQKLAEATTIASNITRQSTDVVADQLTAMVNAFGTTTSDVMTDVVDVFAKVGAVSGSNFEELATATQKFASQAKTSGYEGAKGIQEMASQIAVVVETTRQSADSIGIGFKTILSRIQGIKEDSSGEMVSKLSKSVGQLNAELKQLGAEQFEIFDQFGDLKGADQLITELGNTWYEYGDQLSEATKQYVMQEVAGVEQASRLAALFDNWDRYLEILDEAQNSQGTALQQQLIYMDSIDAKAATLRTTFEEMVLGLNLDGIIKSVLDGLTNIMGSITGLTEATSDWGGAFAEILGANKELGETIGAWVPIIGAASVGIQTFFGKTIATRVAMAQVNKQYLAETQQQMQSMNETDQRIMQTKMQIAKFSGVQEAQKYAQAQDKISKNQEKQFQLAMEIFRVEGATIDQLKQRYPELAKILTRYEKQKEIMHDLRDINIKLRNGVVDLNEIFKSVNVETKELLGEYVKINDEAIQNKALEQEINNILQERTSILGSHKEGDMTKLKKEANTVAKEMAGDTVEGLNRNIQDLDDENYAISRNIEQQEARQKAMQKTQMVMGLLSAATLGGTQVIAGMTEMFKEGENKSLGFAKVISGLGTMILTLLPQIQAALAKTGVTFLASLGPLLPWIAGASIAIGALITVMGGFKSEAEKVAEANEKITKTFVEQKERIDALKNTVRDAKDAYTELSETGMTAQEILASGNEELIAKYEEYASAVAESNPALIKGYDAQGRAIIDIANSYEKLNAEVEKQEKLNYQLQSSNVKGYITELSGNYKAATESIEGMRVKQQELQKELESAMKSGDTDDISEISSELAIMNAGIAEQQQILSDNAALIQSQIVAPFFKGDEAVSGFISTMESIPDLQKHVNSFSGSISSVVLNTEALNKAIQAGDIESATRMIDEARSSYQILSRELIENKENAKELLDKFIEMPPHIQQAALQLQGSLSNVDLDVLDEMDTKIEEILTTDKTLGEVLSINEEDLNLSAITDLEDKMASTQKRINELANETDRQGEMVYANREEYNELLGVMSDYEDQLQALKEGQEENATSINASEEAFEDLIDGMSETTEGLIEVSESYNDFLDTLNEMEVGTDGYDAVLDKATMMYAELKEQDADWFASFKESNSAWVAEVEEATGLNLDKYKTLEELRTAAEAEGHNIRLQGTLFASQAELDAWRATKLAEMQDSYNAAVYSHSQSEWSIMGSIQLYQQLTAAGFTAGESIKIVFASIGDAILNGIAGAINSTTGNIAEFINWVRESINSVISDLNKLPMVNIPLIKGNVKGTSFKTDRNSGKKLADELASNKVSNQGTVMDKVKPPSLPKLPPTSTDKDSNKVKPNTGGNGGGDKDKGKKDKDKDVKDAELDLDPLYEYERALELLENEMSILQAKEKDLFGKDLISNLQQQNDLLNKKLQILKSEAVVIDQQMERQKGMLSKKGFTFDESGMITNYNEMIEKLTNQANAKTGEAKEQAIADLEQIKETVKDYDKLLTDTSAKLKEDMIKITQEMQENYQQQIEVVIDVNLDLSNAYEKIYEFQQKFNEGFEKSDESLQNMGEYAQSLMGDLKMMEDVISNIANDANLTEKQKGEMLKKYIEEYMDAAENLDDVIKEMGEKITESLEQGLELIEKTAEGYEKIKDYAKEYSDLLQDIYGPAALDDIMALYDVQIEAQKGLAESLKQQQALAQQYVDALEPGSEEWKKAKEELDKINMEIANNTLDLLDLMRSKMQDFFDLSRQALEQDIFGGKSLDDIEDTFDRINAQQDKYVNTAEKAHKIGKLELQIQQEIAKTNDPKKKAMLQGFIDKELKALKEKDKLTEKDVERAEKIYLLMLKQQALENQRLTATMARLVRDESGNWSYEYVQDVSKVGEAQQDLADGLEDLMNSDKANLKDNQNEMLELYNQYFSDLEKLQEKAMAGEFESPEAFDKALEDLNKNFTDQFAQLEKEQENLLGNMTQSSLAYIMNMYKQNGGGLGIFSSDTEKVMGGLLSSLESGNLAWTDVINGNYDLIAKELGITKEEAQKAIEEMTDSITEDFKNSNEFIKLDYEDLKNKIATATTEMSKSFNDYFTRVTENMGNQKDAINGLNTALGQQKEQIDKVTQSVKDEANAITTTLIPSYNALKDKYDKEVNPKTQEFITKLKDTVTELKNNNTAITGKQGLNEALGSLQKEFEDSKKAAGDLIGSASNNTGLKGMEKSANDAYSKITTLTGTTTRSNISSTKSSIEGVDGAVGSVNSSLGGMTSSARSAVNGVIGEIGRIPDSHTVQIKVKDKITKIDSLGPNRERYTTSVGYQKIGYGFDIGDTLTFKSGGYTGDWNPSEGIASDKDKGKLAVLHQKELVLNAEDTKNLLDAVKINKEAFAKLGTPVHNVQTVNNNNTQAGDTVIQIENIELPGVDDANKFLQELKNLPNRAIQYKYSKKSY